MNRKCCRVSESHNQPNFFRLFLWWVWWSFRWYQCRREKRKWKTAIRIVLKVLNISLPIIIKSNGDVMMLWKRNSFEWPDEFLGSCESSKKFNFVCRFHSFTAHRDESTTKIYQWEIADGLLIEIRFEFFSQLFNSHIWKVDDIQTKKESIWKRRLFSGCFTESIDINDLKKAKPQKFFNFQLFLLFSLFIFLSWDSKRYQHWYNIKTDFGLIKQGE